MSKFPLFSSHLELAHAYWERLLKPGDWVIDATCGNGKDTLFLATLLLKNPCDSGVIAIDLQATAIEKTKTLCPFHPIYFFCQSHETFPQIAYLKPIRLIVYNLGYLPGSNKKIKTLSSTTLISLKNALSILLPGGAISITCYPGHQEGAEEEAMLLEMAEQLNPRLWNVTYHKRLNCLSAPSLLLFQKCELQI